MDDLFDQARFCPRPAGAAISSGRPRPAVTPANQSRSVASFFSPSSRPAGAALPASAVAAIASYTLLLSTREDAGKGWCASWRGAVHRARSGSAARLLGSYAGAGSLCCRGVDRCYWAVLETRQLIDDGLMMAARDERARALADAVVRSGVGLIARVLARGGWW